MGGRYAIKKPQEKRKNLFIVILVIFTILILIVVVLFVVFCNTKENTETISNISENASQIVSVSESNLVEYESTDATSGLTTASPYVVEKETQVVYDDIVLPGEENADESFRFSAEFFAYKAVDTEDGRRTTLREVFGSSYSGGTFVFNQDGTFQDKISVTDVNSGAYAIVDGKICITYTNDKNKIIEVLSRDENYVPTEILINYGGYDVYFKS